MKQVQKLAGASALGLYLAEGASEGSTAETYKVRTAWDHRDKSKRTKCVRTMGTEGENQHEVWLTLWSKDHADMKAIKTAVARASAWKQPEGGAEGVGYKHGPLTLGFDEAKGTVTLIYAENRKEPFATTEYCAHLGELFDEITAIAASSRRESDEQVVLEEEAPVAKMVESSKEEPVEAHPHVYAGPADLVAALESGEIEIYKKRANVRIGAHEADVVVVDDPRGKRVMLTIGGVGELDAGALASCRGKLGNPIYSARPAAGEGLVIKRTFRSMPPPAAIREAIDYAVDFLKVLEGLPRPPEGPPPEEPLPPPEESVGASGPRPPAPDETEAALPPPPAAEARESSQPPAEAEPPPALSSEIIEEEEISLEELLASPAKETPAPAEAAPADSERTPAEAATGAHRGAPGETAPPEPAPGGGVDELRARVRELEARLGQKSQGPSPADSGPAATEPPQAATGGPSAKEFADEPAAKLPEEVPDTLFGKYRARRAIGWDVLGVLYQGEDTETGEAAAIKVIDKEHTQNPRFAKGFIRESWAATKLEHPGLKRILTVGRTKDHSYYYISEFVEATSARAVVESGQGFSPPEANRVVRAVAEALAFAHSQKVFNGDIRPSNVLVTPEGGVKLAEMAAATNVLGCIERLLQSRDWGLADALKDERNEARKEMERILRERRVVTSYLAPELAEAQGQADARTDVYGLGATWYHMATGRPPFEGVPPLKMLLGKGGAATPPHEINPAVSPEVSRVIQKMMAPLPPERYQSMEEVVAEVNRVRGL